MLWRARVLERKSKLNVEWKKELEEGESQIDR